MASQKYKTEKCLICNGRGWTNGKRNGWPVTIPCRHCRGRGWIKVPL